MQWIDYDNAVELYYTEQEVAEALTLYREYLSSAIGWYDLLDGRDEQHVQMSADQWEATLNYAHADYEQALDSYEELQIAIADLSRLVTR